MKARYVAAPAILLIGLFCAREPTYVAALRPVSRTAENTETQGSGMAEFWIQSNVMQMRYELSVDKLEGVSEAYLAFASGDSANIPIAMLYPPKDIRDVKTDTVSGVIAEGLISRADLIGPIPRESLDALVVNIRRGNVVAIVATRDQPNGAIGGKVTPPPQGR